MSKIKPKRSYTAGSVPTTSDLDTHEIAISWADSKLFVKNAAGQIVSVALGGGGASTEDSVLRSLFVPPAPTGLTATAGNGAATLLWTAPTVLAQTPITDYREQYSSDGGTTWTTFTAAASTAASSTITGLANSTAYVFRVAGVNAAGVGAYSTASSAVTPAAGDPLFSSVALLLRMDGAGNSFVDSSATPKTITANGNSTQSAAQSPVGGKSGFFDGNGDFLTAGSIPLGSSDFVIEGWFYLTSSPPDGTFTTLFAHRANSATTGGALLVMNGSSLLYFIAGSSGWQVVGSSTGLSVSANTWMHIALVRSGNECRAYLNGTGGNVVSVSGEIGTNGSFSVMSGAADGSQAVAGYCDDFRVTVGNNRSYTGATIPVPTAAFPDGPMSAPTSLTATGGNAQVSLTWTAPAYNGGSAITDYSVQFSSNSGATWTTVSRTASTTASQVVTGLTNGTAYVFRVAGINSNGTGTYTAASSSATPSSASLTVSPATLTSNGGSLGGGTVFTWSGAGTVGNKLTTGGTLRQGRFGTGGSSGQVGFRIPEFTCGVSGTLFFEWGSEEDGEGGDYYGGLTQYRKNGNLSTSFATSQVDSNAMSTRGISVSAGDIIRLHAFVGTEPYTPLRVWIQ